VDIKFLGTGGVFDTEYGSSSAIVDFGKRVLIDCGPSTYARLAALNTVDSIDVLALTHLHGDHVGSIFQYIFHKKNKSEQTAKILSLSNEFDADISSLLKLQGVPDGYYEFVSVEDFDCVSAIDTTGKHVPGLISYSYIFEKEGETIFYSGDLGDISVLKGFLLNRSRKELRIFHEMHFVKGSAHVHYEDLMAVADDLEIYGYHVDPTKLPKDCTIPHVTSNESLLA